MNSKLTLFLYIVGLSAITFWAYPIITERYFSGEEKIETTSPQSDCESGETCEISLESPEFKDVEEAKEIMEENITEPTENSFIKITRTDCANECETFNVENEKKYCMQICGLSTTKSPSDDCNDLGGLEKDYCWKNEAIEKTDFSICNKIGDSGIKKSCQNRITEDIVDNQKINN